MRNKRAFYYCEYIPPMVELLPRGGYIIECDLYRNALDAARAEKSRYMGGVRYPNQWRTSVRCLLLDVDILRVLVFAFNYLRPLPLVFADALKNPDFVLFVRDCCRSLGLPFIK